jgi:transposase-like protein
VLVAIGVSEEGFHEEGFREVLACGAGFRESEESWRGLLRDLKAAMADFLPSAV